MNPMHGKWPLALVEWVDSVGAGNQWQEIPSPMPEQTPHICKSVGWLVGFGERYVVLVPHINGPNDEIGKEHWSGCGDMAIPRKAITHMQVFTEEYANNASL